MERSAEHVVVAEALQGFLNLVAGTRWKPSFTKSSSRRTSTGLEERTKEGKVRTRRAARSALDNVPSRCEERRGLTFVLSVRDRWEMAQGESFCESARANGRG